MKRVCLGRITNVHGLKGLVKIQPFGDDVRLLEDLSPLYTSEQGDDTVSVTLKNSQGKVWLAEIEGVHDRNEAEHYKGLELYVSRDSLPNLDEDDGVYHEDMIDMIASFENGEDAGLVITVANFGAGDLLEIKPKIGSAFYVPIAEMYVSNIDTDTKTIILTDNALALKDL